MSDIFIDDIRVTGTPFRLGAALSKTFSVLSHQFGKFILLTLIPMSVLLIFILAVASGVVKTQATNVGVLGGVSAILAFFLQIVAQGTTLYGAFQEMSGRPFTLGQSLQVGLGRALPVIGVALSSGIAVGLGSMLLIIPGLIFFCMFYVAVPVSVIEKPGVFASLSRSAKLTKGSRWQILGLVLLVVVIGAVVQVILSRLGGPGIVGQLLEFAWQVVATTFGAVLVAVVYHDLRVAKEGVDTSTLASVFD